MAEILLTGIEMPKDKVNLLISSDGTILKGDTVDGVSRYLIVGNAKAIEVPTHKRLVEAEKLRNKIDDLSCKEEQTYTEFYFGVLKAIDKAPTVIEAST